MSQTEYSASRLVAFLEDDDDSQILHPRTSTEAIIHGHTSRMAAYLDDFEAAMKKGWLFHGRAQTSNVRIEQPAWTK